jgi:4-amino-4-deoxy-L-arabinose transferase-like glycosyltransferase
VSAGAASAHPTRAPVAIVVGCLLLRLLLALGTDAYPDEAYYWTWSQHPQLAYFDHPALIAWSISFFGLRAGAVLWGALTLGGVHRLTTQLGGTCEQAWWATALFASTPAAALLGSLSTPDAPLLAFWVWTLVALTAGRPLLTGLLWGLAMLSKYNGLLLAVPVLAVFFRRPLHLLACTTIALALNSPTIVWNARNGWQGFHFQLWHGLESGGGGAWSLLEYAGGQLAMAGPLLAGLVAWWVARGRPRPELKLATIVPLVLFGVAAWRARGEANWAAAAWPSACAGLALTAPRGWKHAALALNLAMLAVLTPLLVFPPRVLWGAPHVRNLHDWSVLERVAREQVPVFSGRYQLSALAAFYTHLPSTTLGGRRSQFDLWPAPTLAPGSDAVWISEHSDEPPAELVERFEAVTELDWPMSARARVLHPLRLFRLRQRK